MTICRDGKMLDPRLCDVMKMDYRGSSKEPGAKRELKLATGKTRIAFVFSAVKSIFR